MQYARLCRRIRESVGVPVILAGGLSADNVVEAIRFVRPWGVDVETGTSDSSGIPNAQLVRQFVSLAKNAAPG